MVANAIRRGYWEQDAHTLVATLQLGRVVIEARHRAYQDKPESEKVELMTRREWIRSIRDTDIPQSQMEKADIRSVSNLTLRQGQQDHESLAQLGVKIEGYHKRVR